MNNDFMTGESELYYILYSDISLSFFEYSGWYQVNYEYADDVLCGYHKGCGFLVDECVNN